MVSSCEDMDNLHIVFGWRLRLSLQTPLHYDTWANATRTLDASVLNGNVSGAELDDDLADSGTCSSWAGANAVRLDAVLRPLGTHALTRFLTAPLVAVYGAIVGRANSLCMEPMLRWSSTLPERCSTGHHWPTRWPVSPPIPHAS